MTATILLVEDEPELQSYIAATLRAQGYHVRGALDGASAKLLEPGCDLAVLDLQLPQVCGLEVLHSWRQNGSTLPVLILSASDQEVDRVAGLDGGADDYLGKPFGPREFLARVAALLRRSRTVHIQGPLRLDEQRKRVFCGNQPLDLSRLEYEVLQQLVGQPGRSFSREELLDLVWGEQYLGDTRRVDLVVSKIRCKLREHGREENLRSVWGVGYRYEA